MGKVINEVVECRAKLVHEISDKKPEFGGGLPEDFSDDALLAALLIEVDVGSVRVFFAPPTDFSFDALQVLRGSSQSGFVIVLVGHRLKK